ncbi:hypothetical protein Bbelb_105620 [Branchiostoma belcheri]|nr:hypothetical protein Bbelb_105620 [Branchiostoma belcheri]
MRTPVYPYKSHRDRQDAMPASRSLVEATSKPPVRSAAVSDKSRAHAHALPVVSGARDPCPPERDVISKQILFAGKTEKVAGLRRLEVHTSFLRFLCAGTSPLRAYVSPISS